MTDLELFLKYNMISTKQYKKDEELDYLLFSEQISPKHRAKVNNFVIILEYSYNCNLNCVYCENSELRKIYGNNIISENNIRKIINVFGPKLKYLQFHGGETLLVPDNLLLAIIDEKQKNNYDFQIGLQTNGVLYTEEKKQFLENLNIDVGFSYDGIFNLENRGQVSNDKMLQILANQKYLPINNVITEKNLQHNNALIENYNFYKNQLQATSFNSTIIRNIINDTNIENDQLIEIDNQFVQQILDYYEYWMKDIDHPIHEVTIEKQILRLLNESQRCFDIYCMDGIFRIDPYGNIGPCGCNLIENNYCNINDINNLEEFLNNEKYLKTLQRTRDLIKGNCSKCPWVISCNGGCMGLNYELNPSYTQINKNFCNYTKYILTGIYKIIKNIDLEKDKDKYNPYLLEILRKNNYYSFNEILAIENKYGKGLNF